VIVKPEIIGVVKNRFAYEGRFFHIHKNLTNNLALTDFTFAPKIPSENLVMYMKSKHLNKSTMH